MYVLLAAMRGVMEAVDVVGCVESRLRNNKIRNKMSHGFRAGSIAYLAHSQLCSNQMEMADTNPTTNLLRSSTLISQGAEAASLVGSI